MKAVVADYGTGNLHSLVQALRANGADVIVQTDPRHLLKGDALVLPGVGAFSAGATRLSDTRTSLCQAIRDGHPCLAICLGMQLLFEHSEEGPGEGLAVIAGTVRRLTSRIIPHMGWNTLDDVSDPAITAAGMTTAYFANSYTCSPGSPDVVVAWTTHESGRFPAAVRTANTLGLQFHPEKSAREGLALIGAFLREVRA